MTIQKYFRWAIIVGCFVALLTPLFVSNSLFFPFITGKAFFFRIIVEIVFALWLILIVRDRSARPIRSPLLIALAAFGVIITLATIFSNYPYHSFWSNFERMEGLVSYLHLAAFWLVIASVFKTDRIWRAFLNSSLVVSFIIVVYGFLQLAGLAEIHQSSVRLDATLGNATYLAVYILINIFIALYLLLGTKVSRPLKYLYSVLLVLQLIILYHTATRGAILGLIFGLLVASVLALWRGRDYLSPKLKKATIGVFLAIIVIVGGLFLIRSSSFVQNSPVLSRFASISLSERTTESRLVIWQMSLRGAKEHPLLGWGPENYDIVFNEYYEPALWRQEQWFDRSHNIFLDWLISAGALGLLGYLSLFVIALYLIWRRPREGQNIQLNVIGQSVLTGLLVAYFFQNIFVFDNLMSYIMFLSILAYLHFAATKRVVVDKTLSSKTGYQIVVAVVGVVVLILVIYFVNYKPIMAAKNLVLGISPYPAAEKLASFKKVFALDTFGSAEASEQAVMAATNLASDTKVPVAIREEMAKLALEKINQQIEMRPESSRLYLFLSSVYEIFGQTDLALQAITKAEELSPRKQSTINQATSILMAGGKFSEALMTAKRAYELDKKAIEPLKIYTLVAIYAGEKKLANDLSLELKSINPIELLDDRFINAYAEVKQYDTVLQIWQAKVALDEKNADSHLRLAAAYLVTGQTQNSIKELEIVISLDPSKKADGEYLINEIKSGRNPLQK
jgi:O-antigen ligase/tetratricopeptide (TPR) repeat protein